MMPSRLRSLRNTFQLPRRANMNTFRGKSFKEVWLGDSGYHPLVGIIGLICVLPAIAGGYFFFGSPHSKSLRPSKEGVLPEEEVEHNAKDE